MSGLRRWQRAGAARLGGPQPLCLAINEAGELFVSDNDMEEKGDRSIAEGPDRIWFIRNSRTAPGSVRVPDWYGFPDIAADGLPVWHERHRPVRGTPALPFLLNPPAGPGRRPCCSSRIPAWG